MKITNIKTLDEVNSTNTYVKDERNTLDVGTLVRARVQIAGKGRRERQWITEGDKNLTFSFYTQSDSLAFYKLFMATALSIVKTLKRYKIEASIKLPNDIYIQDKKVAGILIETIQDEEVCHYVTGVGINVNERKPELYDPKATSLHKVLNKSIDIDAFLNEFIETFNKTHATPHLFDIFRDYVMTSTHHIQYDGKTYKLADFNQAFQCKIIRDEESQTIDCHLLTFFVE